MVTSCSSVRRVDAKHVKPPSVGVTPRRRNLCRHHERWQPPNGRGSLTQTKAAEESSSSSDEAPVSDVPVSEDTTPQTSDVPEVLDEDAPPVLSEQAQKAIKRVEDEVKNASAQSVDLCKPTAANQYLPKPPGFSLPLPPEPVRFPRTKLNIRLAVLLLRSGYETIDAMDVLPMDQFQIKFWKSRQAEWEPYRSLYSPLTITQGELTDPLYFDFISYVQFNVVGREIPKSTNVFEERSGAEGTVKVIRRDPSLSDNSLLPAVLAQRLGDTIYARLRFGFEDTVFEGCPEPLNLNSGTSDEVVTQNFEVIRNGLCELTKCMVSKGYGLRSEISILETQTYKKKQKVKIVVEGVANLWGAQALAARGVTPMNEYIGFTLTAFCRASGVGSYYSTKQSDTATEIEFTIVLP